MSPPVLVRHLMTSPVVTFFAESTLPLAEDVMRLHKFRHLPVIEPDGRLVGLVTHRDLMRGQISPLTGLSDEERRARHEEIKIRQLMTIDIWTTSPDALASRAGLTLLDHRYGCLPVVDEHQILVGILTERDFLRFAVRTIEMHDPERLPLPRARTRTSSASIRGCASPHTLDSVAELL